MDWTPKWYPATGFTRQQAIFEKNRMLEPKQNDIVI